MTSIVCPANSHLTDQDMPILSFRGTDRIQTFFSLQHSLADALKAAEFTLAD